MTICDHRMMACLSLVMLGCGTGPTSPVGSPTPSEEVMVTHVYLDPPVVDLGEISLRVPSRFTAKLVNQGTKIVEILGFDSTCGCAGLSATKTSCPPGEGVELSGTFRGGEQAGKFRQQLTIRVKDAPLDVYTLQIVGTVVPQLTVDPPEVVLEPDSILGKKGMTTASITNHSTSAIHVQKPINIPEGLQITLAVTEIPPGGKIPVLFTVDPKVILSSRSVVQIPTTHPLENTLSFSLHVNPIHPVAVVPEAIRLGVVTKAELLSRGPLTLRLVGEGLKHVRIGKVMLPAFLEKIEVRSTAPGEVECVVRVVDRFPGIDLSGQIRIELFPADSPDGVSVPVVVSVTVSGLLESR